MATLVSAGAKVSADILWRNKGQAAYAPRFRLDLKSSGTVGWNEGIWVTSPAAAPGYTATVTVYKNVPADWGPTFISVKIMLEGLVGSIWERTNLLEIPQPSPAWVEIISVTPYAEG